MAKSAGPKGYVYTFEPIPKNYDRLIQNIRSNSFENISSHIEKNEEELTDPSQITGGHILAN